MAPGFPPRFSQGADTPGPLEDADHLWGGLDDDSRLGRHLQWYLIQMLDGVKELTLDFPSRYRHFRDVWVRYARWDLGRVDLVDPQQGTILAPLYPLDRQAHADGQRLLCPLEGPREAAADQQQTEGAGN